MGCFLFYTPIFKFAIKQNTTRLNSIETITGLPGQYRLLCPQKPGIAVGS
jgi:hypothetical protein